MNDKLRLQQTDPAEGGLACLAAAAWALGHRIEMSTLRIQSPISTRGLSPGDLADLAPSIGLAGRVVETTADDLAGLQKPAILRWGLNGYVLLEAGDARGLKIFDPAIGSRRAGWSEVRNQFAGLAIEMIRTPAFTRRRDPSPLKAFGLLTWSGDVRGALVQVLILSIVLQAYVLASPFYMRLVIDESLVNGDLELLNALAIGFALFAAFNLGAGILRNVVTQKLTSLLSWHMSRRIFRHLVRLPLPWFQRRRLADVLTRFQGLEPVKNLIANGLVGSVIDGALSITTLVMMAVFSPSLAVIAVLAVGLSAVVRLASFPVTLKVSSRSLLASIAEQGKRIETLRAMQTIKVMAAEGEREADWGDKLADSIRANQASSILTNVFGSVQGFFLSAASVLIVFLGAKHILAGEMTIGLLYAFMAYQGQFSSRMGSLVETAISWRMLDLYTSRLADIALTPTEPGIDKASQARPERGEIELRGVSFQYSPQDPVILRNVDLKISPGEFVAIVGPSGAGKSTLLKIICGLYPPPAGKVLFDGQPISHWGPRAVRRSIGAVMQDDELLMGTIAENVCFFDEQVDLARVEECLRLACIEEDIRAMPFGINTPIGDMGLSLSGGQRQRVFLARALYRGPSLLVLDEATSHLDVARERQIGDMLAAQGVTRVVVAHRPETVMAADKVVVLRNGLIEVQTQRRSMMEGAV